MSETPNQPEPANRSGGPTPIGELLEDFVADIVSHKRPPMPKNAQAAALGRLTEGSAEEHLELLHRYQAGEDIDPEVIAASRQGVWGDEADRLDHDPAAHARDVLDERDEP